MALSSGIKFRCYPTEGQKLALSRWMGCQRVINNAKVAEDRYFRTVSGKALSLAGINPPIDQKYSQFKNRELTPYLYEVPSQILRNGATRFKIASSRFFSGLAGLSSRRSREDKAYGSPMSCSGSRPRGNQRTGRARPCMTASLSWEGESMTWEN